MAARIGRRPKTERGRKHRRPTAIDVFAGCGGLTSGLRAAGFDVIAAVELDADAATSYAANHPQVKLYRDDIRKVSPARMSSDLRLKSVGGLDLLAGCPPCQGFTRLTENNGRRDPRNALVREYLRFVKVLRPKVCMLENVPGLQTRGKRYFEELVEGLRDAGYAVAQEVVELADYGVPQFRKRLVLLASRIGRVSVPEPSHGEPGSSGSSPRIAWRTVRQAIGGMSAPPLRSDVKKGTARLRYEWHYARDVDRLVRRRLLHAIGHDGSRTTLPKSLRLACHTKRPDGFYDVYGTMEWDSPSPTITSGCTNASKGRFGHPASPRPMTAAEAAALQTFPRSYKFKGTGVESVARQIGNALPRRFARIVGKTVIRHLAANSKSKRA